VRDADRASIRLFGSWCSAILWLTVSGILPVQAAQYEYGIGFSVTHTSNSFRVPSDPRADWIEVPSGRLGYLENTVDVSSLIRAQVERRNYVRDTFGDDTGVRLNGALLWRIFPRQITWAVEDVASEIRIDASTPDTPANRTQTNSLSTGPDFTFRMSQSADLVVGARYGRFDIRGPGDSQRYTAYGRWLERISGPTTLSLNYEASRTHFEPPSLFDRHHRENLFARFDTRSLDMRSYRNSMTIDLGATRVTRSGEETVSRPLARLSAVHQLNSESMIRAYLSEEMSDNYSDLIQTVNAPTGGTVQGALAGSFVASTDLYRSQRGDLTYDVNSGGRFGYTLQGYARRIAYVQSQSRDYDERGVRVTWTWLSLAGTQIGAYGDYLKRTFVTLDQKDSERSSVLRATYLLSRSVNVAVEGGRFSRDSTATQTNFVDRRVMLTLSYSSGVIRTVDYTR
jgi:hypothetical protein